LKNGKKLILSSPCSGFLPGVVAFFAKSQEVEELRKNPGKAIKFLEIITESGN
jgi:hypothetical protein